MLITVSLLLFIKYYDLIIYKSLLLSIAPTRILQNRLLKNISDFINSPSMEELRTSDTLNRNNWMLEKNMRTESLNKLNGLIDSEKILFSAKPVGFTEKNFETLLLDIIESNSYVMESNEGVDVEHEVEEDDLVHSFEENLNSYYEKIAWDAQEHAHVNGNMAMCKNPNCGNVQEWISNCSTMLCGGLLRISFFLTENFKIIYYLILSRPRSRCSVKEQGWYCKWVRCIVR